ncbi:VOC family protein [Oleiagrimonas soli]|uniref:Glyoxalase n=1 Tax=Oleiagrimonas soli TaxID=1543381 RepID=A0A099CT62_9GAMM|nr:VOC family protein [Oleiagrimonas soli]KGI77148.1 glyoxalase [Oleiagrimonas soli]MBB6185439.1 putative enzyme related to lactoylglutathione lyase [Oleiagrimonas soli]
MDFVSIRLITDDITCLVDFYAHVTGVSPTWYTEDFAELRMPSCTLAIGSTRTLALFDDEDAARAADNRSAILEFRVEDVDAAFERLHDTLRDVVQKPKTMPWGNRSLLVRDPDGNLVNLFAPVTDAARERLDGVTV